MSCIPQNLAHFCVWYRPWHGFPLLAAQSDSDGGCRRGEDILRSTGLGYTIVRPGPLLEEPGGYKALVFDQGNRITQSISIADVADVSLKV